MSDSENEASPTGGVQPDDELSLLDLMKFVRRHGAILLGGALTGSTLWLAVAFTLPAQWESHVLIQVGQVWSTGSTGIPIETFAKVIDRIKQASFRDAVIERLKISSNEPSSKTGSFFLDAKIEKSELLNLRVQGTSREMMERLASLAVEELKDVHAKRAEPTIARWRKELDEVNLELERTDKELERLNRWLGKQTDLANEKNMSQYLLASNILLSREAASRELRKNKHTLQEQLSQERTFPTSSWGRIEASEQPVFPRKSLFAAGGLVSGLFMGVLLSLWRSRASVDKKR